MTTHLLTNTESFKAGWSCGAKFNRKKPAGHSWDPKEVTCEKCIKMALEAKGVTAATPDWRPEVPVAEDLYAA